VTKKFWIFVFEIKQFATCKYLMAEQKKTNIRDSLSELLQKGVVRRRETIIRSLVKINRRSLVKV
jgi:hypothetical protein